MLLDKYILPKAGQIALMAVVQILVHQRTSRLSRDQTAPILARY